MLHDKLITENFLHHVQKEQILSPHSISPTKMDLYSAYRYKLHRQALRHHQESQVLDLSRRCDSVETLPRKTPSPYHRSSSLENSPPNDFNTSSLSPPTSASGLAVNLQKLYSQQTIIQPTTTTPNYSNHSNSLLTSNSSLPIYPLYYPQIKQEDDLSIPMHPMNNSISRTKNNTPPHMPLFPQNYQSQSNLLQSINLMKSTSYPSHQLTNLPTIQNVSPKNGFKADSDDRMSDVSSIPGSPSSSTSAIIGSNNSIVYPKLISNTTTTINESNNVKTTRPFKAFPRDPLVIAANFAATDVLYDNPRVERYTEYRKRVLEQIRTANGGERTVTNPKMRRLNNRNSSNNNKNNQNSSDGSNSDYHTNNSETEDRTNDSSDNDSTVQSTTKNYDNGKNSDDHNINNNSSEYQNINNGINVVKDAAYYERRRKNNAAAKKSRDRRRIKEDEIAIRAAYLERQNIELLCQLDAMKAQIATLTKCQSNS